MYSAPEVLQPKSIGEGYTHSVDWWSLGVLLFALLEGQVSLISFLIVHLMQFSCHKRIPTICGNKLYHGLRLLWPERKVAKKKEMLKITGEPGFVKL